MARKEKEERDRRRAEDAQKQYEQTQARRMAVRTRKPHERMAVTERREATGRQMRELEQEWAEARRREMSVLQASLKSRVKEARGLDSRLDAQEAAVDASEREEAGAEKAVREAALKQVREQKVGSRGRAS
jgi:hypothetical protein